MRNFKSGAFRDTDTNKLDYEGFLSPLVLKKYAEYMDFHRTQADGKQRDSDNWQFGIPFSVYMKSLWRHFWDVWYWHRNKPHTTPAKEHQIDALCAVLFNTSGYLHQLLTTPEPKTKSHRNHFWEWGTNQWSKTNGSSNHTRSDNHPLD